MDYRMEQMSVSEYARIQSLRGVRTVQLGSIYWKEVRPHFYRPLLSYVSLDRKRVMAPRQSFGGYQYAVGPEENANSAINFRVFDDCACYSLANQGREYRRMVRAGAKVFDVRPI